MGIRDLFERSQAALQKEQTAALFELARENGLLAEIGSERSSVMGKRLGLEVEKARTGYLEVKESYQREQRIGSVPELVTKIRA